MNLKVIDLSAVLREGEKGALSEVKILQEMTRRWSGRHFKKPCEGWESRNIIVSEHCGTHVDAPYHFVPNTKTIDEIPVDHFLGSAVLLDLRGSQKPGQPIQKQDLVNACSTKNIEIQGGDIVLLLSKEGSKGLTNDAVDWLIDKRIKGVGTNIFIEEDVVEDGLAIRYAHVGFLSKGISIFEGLVSLDKISGTRFTFIGLPLKIDKGTGSPIRAVAVIQGF